MSNYKDLLYHQASFKASHNSYERKESLAEQIDKYGCRGLELDISQSSDGSKWSVSHGLSYNPQQKQFDEYLKELNDWSESKTGHDAITVHLDLKSIEKDFVRDKTFPSLLDSYILDNFDREKIFKPQELIRNGQSLSASTANGQWGKLSELENKFIFCLTGSGSIEEADETVKIIYATTNFPERLCFADVIRSQQEQPSSDLITRGNRIFFNYEFNQPTAPTDIDKNWTDKIKLNAKNGNVILRTYTIKNKQQLELALQTGFNIISLDKIQEKWAKVGDDPFV
jgi:Phosphoinositide phospholipase C, Ca2+-dependent